MKKTYYSAADLRKSLDAFEAKFGMSSADFHALYAEYDEARMESIPRYHRFSWAAFYGEWCRLSGDQCVSAGGGLHTH